ncbi:MAG: ribonuclease P protein component 4 [Promethearchaeota archaeon]
MGRSFQQYKRRFGRRKQNSYQRKQKLMKTVAKERVEALFQRAEIIYPTNPEYAHRYVMHARKIAMSAKITIPRVLKRRVCHHCKHYLVPGKNMRFRLNHRNRYGSWVAVTCLDCGHITRYLVKGPASKFFDSQSQSHSQSQPQSQPQSQSHSQSQPQSQPQSQSQSQPQSQPQFHSQSQSQSQPQSRSDFKSLSSSDYPSSSQDNIPQKSTREKKQNPNPPSNNP